MSFLIIWLYPEETWVPSIHFHVPSLSRSWNPSQMHLCLAKSRKLPRIKSCGGKTVKIFFTLSKTRKKTLFQVQIFYIRLLWRKKKIHKLYGWTQLKMKIYARVNTFIYLFHGAKVKIVKLQQQQQISKRKVKQIEFQLYKKRRRVKQSMMKVCYGSLHLKTKWLSIKKEDIIFLSLQSVYDFFL